MFHTSESQELRVKKRRPFSIAASRRGSETPQALSKFLAAGKFPSSDSSNEILVGGDTATKLGFTPSTAVGHKITFHGQFPGIYLPGSGQQPAANSLPLELSIVGVLSNAGNLGSGGAYFISAPYSTATMSPFERPNSCASRLLYSSTRSA